MAKPRKRAMKKQPEYVTKPHFDEAMAGVDAKLTAMEHRLSAQLASHTNAIMEYVAGLIRVVDDKYADLPGRVSLLEAKVSG